MSRRDDRPDHSATPDEEDVANRLDRLGRALDVIKTYQISI